MNSAYIHKDHKSDTMRAWIIERIYIHASLQCIDGGKGGGGGA